MTFTKRPLSAGTMLGERLRLLREENSQTVAELSQQIHISQKYIQAIEEARYRDLPGQVYARQFVRQYAQAMDTDVDLALKIFDEEYPIVAKTGQPPRPLLTPRARTEFTWWRRHLRLIIAIAVLLVTMTYLGIQAARIFLPPHLVITQPAGDIATKKLNIVVSGTTDPNATVTINDQSVQTTIAGQFNEPVDLHSGLNTLKITAVKKHGQQKVIIRQVLVE